jgi:hypothetical protein
LKRYAVLIAVGASFLFAGLSAQESHSIITPVAHPDAHRLRLGTFEHRDSSGGKDVGTGTITVQMAGGAGPNYEFSADAKFADAFKGFSTQRWECVATPELRPISATLTFGDATQPPVFDIRYDSGRVGGFVVSRRGPDAGTKRSVDAAVPDNTFDQRIDWATVLANDLRAGERFQFNVYDPTLGASHVEAQVGAAERVHVPAGSFDVYRVVYQIAKSTGTERYEVFASVQIPRMLVGEHFQNGVISELISVKP